MSYVATHEWRLEPLRTVEVGYYCTACRSDGPIDAWPSHYRTRAHREARRAEREHEYVATTPASPDRGGGVPGDLYEL